MERKIKKLWKRGLVPFPLLSLLVLPLAADGTEEHVSPVKPVHVVTLGEAHRGDAAVDTRSCADWQRRNERGSFLGDAQMEWLFATLKASRAKFIILTSGTMWSDYITKGKDSWGEWDPAGLEEIFRFIEDNQIGGVLLLSGDRHGARAFAIPRPSGFALHEFEVASLGGVPGPAASGPDKSTQLFGYPGGLTAFGEFTFDMGKPDPEVTFRLIDEENKELEVHTFRRSQLTPWGGRFRAVNRRKDWRRVLENRKSGDRNDDKK